MNSKHLSMMMQRFDPSFSENSDLFTDPFFDPTRLLRSIMPMANLPFSSDMKFPLIDVHEKENSYVVELDLPGVKREDIKVEVDVNHLILSGEKKLETEETQIFRFNERPKGRFYRRIHLPGVDTSHIKSDFNNGVLTLHISKNASSRKVISL